VGACRAQDKMRENGSMTISVPGKDKVEAHVTIVSAPAFQDRVPWSGRYDL